MQKTKIEQFYASLRATGSYSTPPERRAGRVRQSAWNTIRYTLGVTKVFPYCALTEPFGLLTTEKWARACFSAVTTAEKLGLSVMIEGFDARMKHEGPVVYLCNHMSTTETILLMPVLLAFGPFSYVAKASLAHLPFLTKAAEHMRMVPVGRKSPREDLMAVLNTGTERIKGGDSFLIFPQGTRQEVFSRKVYSSIGAKLAEKAGCPVVPIVVDTRCQLTREKGMFKKVFKDFGPFNPAHDIRVACGPVIQDAKSKVMHEAAFDWMAGKLESWGLPTERADSEKLT
jgi:1-acyl-sn-glycerol-3-phosphate acyltransferase